MPPKITIPKPQIPKIVRPIIRGPRLPAAKPDNPLAKVKPTGDQDHDRRAELAALKESFPKPKDEKTQKFAAAAQSQQQRQQQALDNEFYFVVCFQTREQRDEFLAQRGWTPMLERFVYIDGPTLARYERMSLKPVTQVHNSIAKPNKRLAALT